MNKKQEQITIEKIEKIVLEAIEDYKPGGEGSGFLDSLKGRGGRFRQDNLRKQLRQKYGLGPEKGQKLKPGDEEDPDKEKAGDDKDPVGYPGTEEGDEEKKSALPKDTPVSVMKKQKDVVVGQGGQKEAPLVMHIQKMGLSQSTAQAIAKRVGQYLQQRKIPIAEVVTRLDESLFSDVTSHMLGKMRIDLKSPRPTDKQRANYAMAIHQVAKKGDPEQFRSFVVKRVTEKSKNVAKIMKDADEEMLKKLMNYILTSDKMKAYHELGKKYRETKAAEKEKGRQGVRALGKDKGVIGKIVSRFVGDNQQLINKDPGLKATLDDPVKFNKLAKSIRDMLRSQLKRRGYEAAQIKNLLESVEPTLTLLREQRS